MFTAAGFRDTVAQFDATLTADQQVYVETLTDLVTTAFPPARRTDERAQLVATVRLAVLTMLYLLLRSTEADYRQHWPDR